MTAQDATDGRRLRLIVVDDNPDAGSSLGMLLHVWRHKVAVFQRGQDALDALDAFSPDAMILDIAMPGMSGLELARRVREIPAWSRLPLIAISGNGTDADRQAAVAAGIDYHFVKASHTEPLRRTLVNLK